MRKWDVPAAVALLAALDAEIIGTPCGGPLDIACGNDGIAFGFDRVVAPPDDDPIGYTSINVEAVAGVATGAISPVDATVFAHEGCHEGCRASIEAGAGEPVLQDALTQSIAMGATSSFHSAHFDLVGHDSMATDALGGHHGL